MTTVLRCKICGGKATISGLNVDITWPAGKSPHDRGYAHRHTLQCSLHKGLTLDQLKKDTTIEVLSED